MYDCVPVRESMQECYGMFRILRSKLDRRLHLLGKRSRRDVSTLHFLAIRWTSYYGFRFSPTKRKQWVRKYDGTLRGILSAA